MSRPTVVYGPGDGQPVEVIPPERRVVPVYRQPGMKPRLWTIYVCAECGRHEADFHHPDCQEQLRGQDIRWERVEVMDAPPFPLALPRCRCVPAPVLESPPPTGPTVPESSTQTNNPKEASMATIQNGSMKNHQDEINLAVEAADTAADELTELVLQLPRDYHDWGWHQMTAVQTLAAVAEAKEARAFRLVRCWIAEEAEYNADRRADR